MPVNCSVVLPGSVWTLQRGLKVIHREQGLAVDPGSVDGRWGSRTRFAVNQMMRGMQCSMESLRTIAPAWDAAPARATTVILPLALTRLTDDASRRYVRPISEPELGPPAPFEPGSMELDVIDPPFTVEPRPPAPAPPAPVTPGTAIAPFRPTAALPAIPVLQLQPTTTNWPLWITLGLGLAGAGGVIWFINRRGR